MHERPGDTIFFLALIVLISIGAAIIFPNFIRARARGTVTACKSNLKNIGQALEMYADDNAGAFPDRLSQLTPNYLKCLPTCSTVRLDTYSANYMVYHDTRKAREREAYTVVCSGNHHRGVGLGPNLPQYNSRQGLVER